jgi:ATP-dependent Lon protease
LIFTLAIVNNLLERMENIAIAGYITDEKISNEPVQEVLTTASEEPTSSDKYMVVLN